MDLTEARAQRDAEARALAVPLEELLEVPPLPEPAIGVLDAAVAVGLSPHVLRNAIEDNRVAIIRDEYGRPRVLLLQLQAQLDELRGRERPSRRGERRWR